MVFLKAIPKDRKSLGAQVVSIDGDNKIYRFVFVTFLI
jgi:hypothetical protein